MNSIKYATFAALCACTAATAATYRPGLMQYRYGCAKDSAPVFDYDFSSLAADKRDRTFGIIMGNKSYGNGGTGVLSAMSESATGTQWYWSDNTTYAYEGEIWLEAGTKLMVWGAFDDGSALFIDDMETPVFSQGNSSGYNTKIPVRSFTAQDSKWYKFRGYVWDWTGGKNISQSALAALQWNTENYSMQNSNAPWAKFICDNNFKFLRTETEESFSTINVNASSRVGSSANVTISHSDFPCDVTVDIVSDTSDKGYGHSYDWTMYEQGVEFISAASGETVVTIPYSEDFPIVRFVFRGNDGTNVFEEWTDPVDLSQLPSLNGLGFTKSIIPNYTSASFQISAASFGSASEASILVEVALDDGFTTIVVPQTNIGIVTEDSPTVDWECLPLNANTTYHARIIMTAQGEEALESIVHFSTLDHTPVFSATISGAMTPVITVRVTDPGHDATQVSSIKIFAYADDTIVASREVSVNYEEFPVESPGFSISGIVAGAGVWYSFQVDVENDIGVISSKEIGRWYAEPLNGDNAWANNVSDVNSPSAYVYSDLGLPDKSKTLFFESPAIVNPVIDSDTDMPILRFGQRGMTSANTDIDSGFNAYDYVISGEGLLRLYNESSILMYSKGTNTIENPILFNRSNNGKIKVGGNSGSVLVLSGDLSTPEGVSGINFEPAMDGGSVVHIKGNTKNLGLKRITLSGTGSLSIDSPESLTDATEIYFAGGWGSTSTLRNGSGETLVFPDVTRIFNENGWSSTRSAYSGDPMEFPNAVLEWGPRANDNSQISADVMVHDLVVVKHGSNSTGDFGLRGGGSLTILNGTTYSNTGVANYINIVDGFFNPLTMAGWGPDKTIYVSGNTAVIGLAEDYRPMLDGSSEYLILGEAHNLTFGFAANGGDRVVCYNNDESFNVTNKNQYGSYSYFTDTVKNSSKNKALSTYCAWPQNFAFGSRSKWANGTILFKNPIRHSVNMDISTYCESSGHSVAARLQGQIQIGHRDRTWNFDGRGFGGYISIEAANNEFIGKIVSRNKAHLLVNNDISARSISISTDASIGGTGSISSSEGITVNSGCELFGGEWGMGGCLSVDGKLTFQSGSGIRVEVPGEDRGTGPVGYIKLVNSDTSKTLSITAPIKVRVDLGNLRGAGKVKVLDWSEASYKNGVVPTISDFEAIYDETILAQAPTLSVKDSALYIRFRGINSPDGMAMIVK